MPVELLRDDLGRPLGEIETFGRPTPRADLLADADAPGAAIVEAVWTRLGGHHISVIERADVAAGLVARGGKARRHLFVMTLDLTGAPVRRCDDGPTIEPMTLEPMAVERAAEYGGIISRAYPLGHPDHEPADADPQSAAVAVTALLRGDQVGPWLPDASFHARADDGGVVGAILLSEMPSSVSSPGSPWISEIFVEPTCAGRGVGGALLRRAIDVLARGGRTSLGLAVTAGNPARRLYESYGFAIAQEVVQVVLPGISGRPPDR